MKTQHLIMILPLIFIASILSNNVFADDSTSTSYGGLTGLRIANFKSDNGIYPIWYKITNSTVTGTSLDLQAKALIFTINASSNGMFTVELPRSIIDSKNGTKDIPYYVTVEDIATLIGRPFPVPVNEINNDNPRIIKINFTQTTKQIEIAGTYFVENYSQKAETSHKLLSPLQQYKSGTAAKDVVCKEGLQLMIKTENGSPVCLKPSNVLKLFEREWNLVSYKDYNVQTTRILTLEDSGVVTLKNQTYYFGIPIYTNDAYVHPVQISFHNVLFTLFPSGFRGGLPVGGCPGQYYWADTKFADHAHELLHIFAGSQFCADSIPMMLSNHIEPQAGLTFYDGKLRLLVKVENQGKDIVLQKPSSMAKPFPRCNPNPAMEKLIREKQQVLVDTLMAQEAKYGGFENRTQNLPWSAIGYDCIDNALEVGILPQFFNSDHLPSYFEKIRSIVGNTIDIVLSPEEYATPV